MEILKGHILYIERALGFKLNEDQIAYLLHNKVMPNVRNNGATTVYCIELALSDGEPLDMARPERYSDRQLSMGNVTYSRTFFRPTFLDIREKLNLIGFTVRSLKGDGIVEKTYKVSLWFEDVSNGEDVGEEPNRVIFVTTNKTEKQDITHLALKQVGIYPRSYQVTVDEVEKIEKEELHVIRISNSKDANREAWYYDRDGELFVMRVQGNSGSYVTCHFLGNTFSTGHIPARFCTVVNVFEAEVTF